MIDSSPSASIRRLQIPCSFSSSASTSSCARAIGSRNRPRSISISATRSALIRSATRATGGGSTPFSVSKYFIQSGGWYILSANDEPVELPDGELGFGVAACWSPSVLGVGRWCTNRPITLLGTGNWRTDRPSVLRLSAAAGCAVS